MNRATGVVRPRGKKENAVAFRQLGWPCLWLSNAQENQASRRIKEKQGAQLVDILIGRYVGGECSQMVWQLMREDWIGRQAA